MIIGLIVILIITFILPLISEKVEHNLELFLFIVGILGAIMAGVLNIGFIVQILENKFLYAVTLTVLIGGCLFKKFDSRFKKLIQYILGHVDIKIFVFFMIVSLGLISSIITAIIAALLLVEIINILPLSKKTKINIDILACFSIGLGAALTPIGEPLSTIVTSKLGVGFFYIFKLIGIYVIPLIIIFGLIGAWLVSKDNINDEHVTLVIEEESYYEILIRSVKVFIFIIALELLGAGFKPIIDNYIVHLHSGYLYWINISSAVLDNATIASAQISDHLNSEQVEMILLGLLISGGMMIPGNIPNIISAGKLKIKSKEWIRLGVPMGLVFMISVFGVLILA